MKKTRRDGVKLVKEMAGEECFLCGDIEPSLLVYEDDNFIVMLDKFPAVEGHLILAPRKHVEAISDLSDSEAAELMSLLRKFDRRLREVFNPFRVAIVSSGLAVKHFHFHIIPIPSEEMMWGFKYLDKSETIEYSKQDKEELVERLVE